MNRISLRKSRRARAKKMGVFGALGLIASAVSLAVFALGGLNGRLLGD